MGKRLERWTAVLPGLVSIADVLQNLREMQLESCAKFTLVKVCKDLAGDHENLSSLVEESKDHSAQATFPTDLCGERSVAAALRRGSCERIEKVLRIAYARLLVQDCAPVITREALHRALA